MHRLHLQDEHIHMHCAADVAELMADLPQVSPLLDP